MIIPFIAAVMRDVFEVTPPMLKESAYALGSTTWEVVWKVVLPYTKTGVDRRHHARPRPRARRDDGGDLRHRQLQPARLRCRCSQPANSITSALANEFAEAAAGLHQAALIYLGLVLFFITFVVLALSKLLLLRLRAGGGRADMSRRPLHRPDDAAEATRASCNARRKRVNARRAGAVARGDGVRPVLAGVDPRRDGAARHRRPVARALHADDAAAATPTAAGSPTRSSARSMMVRLATFVGTPIGILAGIYLAEYGQKRLARRASRASSTTSCCRRRRSSIGLFIYAVVVARCKQLLGLGRRARAGADRDPGRDPHDREHADAGAERAARGGLRARHAEVEGRSTSITLKAPRAPAS